jgi:ankyrin repeat protein
VACRNGHTTTVLELIKAYPKFLEIRTTFEDPPLHWACAYGQTETALALLKEYPKLLEERASLGSTALDRANESGHTQTAKDLEDFALKNGFSDLLTPLDWELDWKKDFERTQESPPSSILGKRK